MEDSHLRPEGHDGGTHDNFLSRPDTPAGPEIHIPHHEPRRHRKHRKIVLCFDGTGNKFHGDDSDSNILKIFRMLDRTSSYQYHYYQPGIGTYVVSQNLSHTGPVEKFKSWYKKAKDSAIGSSFDQHVVGGYRFLMRFYNPGDEIYLFGFSRGAYIARFLAEMLDYVGLLSHGNEEMVIFAWKAFSNWQIRKASHTPEGIKKRREMYEFMKNFRETFSRPVRRIRFLGLFDTVNSVPQFETAWMERSKFPYTARTSAKVIRHAVSIDERRAKFRQDLIYQSSNRTQKPKQRNKVQAKLQEFKEAHGGGNRVTSGKTPNVKTRDRKSKLDVPEDPAPYRPRSRSVRSRRTVESVFHDDKSTHSVIPHPHDEEDDVDSAAESEDETDQDIDEVWFAGNHADIGGGWEVLPDSKAASHVPLVWMVHEAMKAGLKFDPDKVREMGCAAALDETSMTPADAQENERPAADGTAEQRPAIPNIVVRSPSTSTPKLFQRAGFGGKKTNAATNSPTTSSSSSSSSSSNSAGDPRTFEETMHRAQVARIHDCLEFGGGLGWTSVLGWKFMEYLPFRRMDLQEDGSWKPIRWPLPCGEVRDIPKNARIHGSVIRRMQMDERYRPGNLIIGGGGRGVRKAPREMGIGDWVCVEREGCPIGEIWMRRDAYEEMMQQKEQGTDEEAKDAANGEKKQ